MLVSPKPRRGLARLHSEQCRGMTSWWTKRASQPGSDCRRPAFARLSVSVLAQFGQPPSLPGWRRDAGGATDAARAR